jgi:hypothetical protein
MLIYIETFSLKLWVPVAGGGQRSRPLHDPPYLLVFDAHFVPITFLFQHQKAGEVGIKCLLLPPLPPLLPPLPPESHRAKAGTARGAGAPGEAAWTLTEPTIVGAEAYSLPPPVGHGVASPGSVPKDLQLDQLQDLHRSGNWPSLRHTKAASSSHLAGPFLQPIPRV